MAERRSYKHRTADKLDSDTFVLCETLDRFADYSKDQDLKAMASTIQSLRYRIRKHMHPKDREATNG